jgi:hypothetical protein
MNVFDFKTAVFFPRRIMFTGVLLVFAVLLVVLKSVVLELIVLLAGIVIFTTHYRLRIDYTNKAFFDYVWILGFKTGDHGRFEKIEYLFIKKSRISQKMNHLAGSAVLQKEVYHGYLKFSDQEKIHLMTKDSKNALVEKLSVISDALKVRIMDYSEGSPKEI